MNTSGADLASFRAVVRGYVQGVFFRDFVRTRARALGLSGYVRNLRQLRAVEVKAEGRRPQLEQLVEYLHRGPAGAIVEDVEVEWGNYSGDFSDFGIAY